MRAFCLALAAAAVLSGGCTKIASCKPHTVFVDLEFVGDALPRQSLFLTTTLVSPKSATPVVRSFPLTHVIEQPNSSVEIDFPTGYPAGATLQVVVSYKTNAGAVITPVPPFFLASVTLNDTCEHTSIRVGQTTAVGDMGTTTDLAGDMAHNSLQCSGVVGYPDPPLVSQSTCLSVSQIALADIDGSGKLALLSNITGGLNFGPGTACWQPDLTTVNIATNPGNGVFAAPAPTLAGQSVGWFSLGDFNRDTKLDLVTAGDGSVDTIAVLLNKGDGSFAASKMYGSSRSGVSPAATAVGDLDGINGPDIVTSDASLNPDSVSVYLNNGDGTFASPAPYYLIGADLGGGGNQVAIGDITHDGKPDIVASNYGTNQIFLLVNQGSGTFASPVPFAVGIQPNAVAIADFDGDGYDDAVVYNNGDHAVGVLLNNQAGGFVGQSEYPTSGRHLATGDVNGDGKPDLLLTADSVVSVLTNNGDGTFAPEVLYSTGGTNALTLALGDIDGDSKPDVVVANSGVNFTVLHNYGDGKFNSTATATSAQTTYPTEGKSPYALAVGDVTGDQKLDLVVANMGSNNIVVLAGRGDGTFSSPSPFAVGAQPEAVALEDLDGDGSLDIAVANSGDATLGILTNDGQGHFGAQVPLQVGTTPSSVLIGDIDGKNGPDLAVANQSDGTVGVILAKSGGGFGPQVTYMTGQNTVSLTFARLFAGDALPAIAVNNGSRLRNNGAGIFTVSAGQLGNTGWSGASSITAGHDFTESSNLDEVFWTYQGGNTCNNCVLITDADNSYHYFQVGESPVAVALGDFNLDGILDLVTANSVDNTISVAYQTSPGGWSNAVQWGTGQEPRALGVADVDGDGRPDILVVNEISNTIGVMLNRCLP